MSLADERSARSSPGPDACPDCDTSASVTSDLHKYQVACTCKPSAQYACAEEPGPPPPAKPDCPPALPPRPPASVLATNRRNNASVGCTNEAPCRRRKYAWWCCGCGALCAALGGLLAAQHILLRAYTASPHHLETVPAAVPAAMLVLTGVCIMSLARRRNRYSYMIKVVGACCLVCALTCVLVTITTTVIHMNKLQTLKFCEYTKLTRTCTCFSMPPNAHHSANDDDGVRCVFEGVTDCGVVHGALYWCLRGVFALSVSAVLVCIFSCMLAYQLLSHERKKMYWEQLELRCRSLYRPPSQALAPGRAVQNTCSCCSQCHPSQPAWDISLQHRFWAPGRIGNLYSPNPGTGRKTSAWSWFPWPRSNSQNSRCRMGGIPQSGDSAYGFCETDSPPQNPAQAYEEGTYPSNFPQPFQRAQNSGTFAQSNNQFAQNSNQFAQNATQFAQSSQFVQTAQFAQGFSQEGFGEPSGSFDAQTGVWGPPPPYSPQGRSGSRHQLHQDPATATLLHHHHIDVHRNSMHDHSNMNIQHSCRNSYMMQHMPQNIQELSRLNPELARLNPELARLNPELARLNPELARLNPELARLNPKLSRLNPEMSRLNSDLARLNPELIAQMYPEELARLQSELAHLGPDRFNTLRGHLVPYTNCQRSLGMSVGNLHRDCRIEDNIAIEFLHQKSASKVSDQSSDSCQKLGKENLGFQNDKNSPVRTSMQDCHRGVNQNAESEVYFADVSSCCNVSVKAECCMNPNVSALVGTIENHPESTSESDTGSFTLTRQQRPQPQVGSKRRPRTDKHLKTDKMRQDVNSSLRLTEQQIEQLNNSMRMSDRMIERMSERSDSRDRLNDSRMCDFDTRDRLNEHRINDARVERINERLNESMRKNESRNERLNDLILCDRMNESKLNDSRISDRMKDSQKERLNDTRIGERINESKLNDSRISDRMADPRNNDSQIIERVNESRISDRMNESRISERMNESRTSERANESRTSDRISIEDRRMSDLNSSFRIDGSPKMRSRMSPLRVPRSSPKNLLKEHPRQSSSDSNKDFFAPTISPISPKTEESLISDEESQKVGEPKTSKCLGPDSQYETVKEKAELKTNHHHCYSDTNTMDSGWQSGSEKQVTD